MVRSRQLQFLAVALTAGAFAAMIQWRQAPKYHPDEGQWLISGQYFWGRLRAGDLRQESWNPQCYRVWGATTPPVGKYLVGGALAISGQRVPAVAPYHHAVRKWDPDPRAVSAGRVPGRICLFLLAVGLPFLVTSLGLNMVTALLAMGLVLFDPFVWAASNRISVDGPALCCSIWSLWLWRHASTTSKLRSFVLCGVVLGLGMATKLTVWLIVPVIVAWWLSEGPHSVRGLSMTFIACGLAFFLVNPSLYHDPIGGIKLILHHIRLIARYPEPEEILTLGSWFRCMFLNSPVDQVFHIPGSGLVSAAVGIILVRRRHAVWLWLLITALLLVICAPRACPRFFMSAKIPLRVLEAAGIAGLLALLRIGLRDAICQCHQRLAQLMRPLWPCIFR